MSTVGEDTSKGLRWQAYQIQGMVDAISATIKIFSQAIQRVAETDLPATEATDVT
jgi:hypothetical protein